MLMSLLYATVINCSANAEVISLPELTTQQSKFEHEKKLMHTKYAVCRDKFMSVQTAEIEVENTSKEPQNLGNKQVRRHRKKAQPGTVKAFNRKNLGSYMTLVPTGQTNVLNNPLYELRLYANGQLVNRFITVSGRTHTQNRNRHQSGTEAPLPNGRYKVSKTVVPGTIVEAGDRFLPIQPLFRTGRTFLGFHVDPSFEKKNGEDGTSGCIGLVSRQDLDQLISFVRTYQPQFLDVKI